MRRSLLLLVIVAIATTLAMITPASAAVEEEFFEGGNGSAGWVSFTPAPPGSSETASILLKIPDGTSYAGVAYSGLPTTAPTTPPSYAFYSDVSGASGGSPRLVMRFSDGGKMELRPLTWTAGSWVTIDGNSNLWDNGGGTCGFLYATTYATGLGCHTGSSVTDVFVVSDSGWLQPGNHYIDDIKYGDLMVSYPLTCNADFTGSHENGPASSVVHELDSALGGVDSGLGGTVHGVNCDVVVPLGL